MNGGRTRGCVASAAWPAYATAAAAVAATALLHAALAPALDESSALMLFLLPVAVVAALRGAGPGLFAAALGFAISVYAFFPPVASVAVERHESRIAALAFALLAVTVSMVAGRVRAALAAARRLARELDARRAELETILELVPAAIAVLPRAADGAPVVNRRHHELFGGAEAATDAGGRGARAGFRLLRGDTELPPERQPARRAAMLGEEIRDEPLDLEFDDGRRLHLLASALPLRDRLGAVRGVVGVHVDVTAVEAARRELELADRRKNEFIATLAHELRDPLAAIDLAANLLRAGAPEDVRERGRQAIVRQSRHVARLLDDLLDVTRIARDVLVLQRERFDARELVRDALETVHALLGARRHAVSTDVPAEPLWIDGDRTRLVQVLANLVGNAAKYTPAGGRIEVAIRCRDGEIEATVADDGVGLPADALERVFEPFARVAAPARPEVPGLGIGLALVRRIVELHGGRVRAQSDGPGRGSRFVVRLPAAGASPTAA